VRKKRKRRKKDRNHRAKNIMVCPITSGDHKEGKKERNHRAKI